MTARTGGLLGAVAALLLSAAAAPARPTDVAEVAKAWADREAKVKSFRFEWTDRMTVPKGSVSRHRSPGMTENPGPIPPADVVFDSPRVLLVDGPRVRYTYELRHWCTPLNAPYADRRDTSFDGSVVHSVSTYDPPVRPPQATVTPEKSHGDVKAPSPRPIVVALRGTAPSFRVYDVAAFEPTGRAVTAGGVACAELVREARGGKTREVLLADPARGYVVVRATYFENRKLASQEDVTYAPDPVAGWVPAAWEHTAFEPDGRVAAAGRAKVTRYEVNPAFAEADLAAPPVPGALVVDTTGPEQKKYVVQPDGRPGKSVPRAAQVSYEQLAAAGPEGAAAWRESLRWWAAGAAFAGSAGLLGWRLTARARSRRQGAAA